MICLISGLTVGLQVSPSICRHLTAVWGKYVLPDSTIPEYDFSIFVMEESQLRVKCDTLNGSGFCFRPEGTDIPVLIRVNGRHADLYIADGRFAVCAVHYASMTVFSGKRLGVHGVTALVGDQLVLFSARSGVGKTTFTGILQREFGAAIINGDYAYLSLQPDGTVMFEPSPFCGSSGICRNHRLSLDRIVFLERGTPYAWQELAARDACGHLFNNCFIPAYDPIRKNQSIDLALSIVQNVPMCKYTFLSTTEAARQFVEKLFK